MALKIQNENLFNQVVSDAIQKAIETCSTEKLAKRWERAIDRAVREINENPFLDYNSEKNELLILSPSNNIYSANGVCQCLAFLNGKQPCWHRACARIWRLYLEADKPLPPAKAAAVAAVGASSNEPHKIPYLKNTNERKLETMAGVRY